MFNFTMDMLISITIITAVLIICLSVIVVTILKNKCKHEWEAVQKIRIDTDGICDYDRVYLRCKKCGDVTFKNLR